jgi:hypothetical protein
MKASAVIAATLCATASFAEAGSLLRSNAAAAAQGTAKLSMGSRRQPHATEVPHGARVPTQYFIVLNSTKTPACKKAHVCLALVGS